MLFGVVVVFFCCSHSSVRHSDPRCSHTEIIQHKKNMADSESFCPLKNKACEESFRMHALRSRYYSEDDDSEYGKPFHCGNDDCHMAIVRSEEPLFRDGYTFEPADARCLECEKMFCGACLTECHGCVFVVRKKYHRLYMRKMRTSVVHFSGSRYKHEYVVLVCNEHFDKEKYVGVCEWADENVCNGISDDKKRALVTHTKALSLAKRQRNK